MKSKIRQEKKLKRSYDTTSFTSIMTLDPQTSGKSTGIAFSSFSLKSIVPSFAGLIIEKTQS